MEFTYTINDRSVATHVEGEILYGDDVVLLEQDDDLTAHTAWAKRGYAVAPFLSRELGEQLREGMRRKIARVLTDAGFDSIVDDRDFRIETYHRLAAGNTQMHKALVEGIRRGLPLTELPIDYHEVERRVGEIVGIDVTAHNRAFGLDVFNLRVVRPESNDNNPLHRDVWLDRLRNAVNIYVPLAGSNELSSLCLVPESHRWAESEIARTAAGALVNGLPYTVPAVVGASKPLQLVRPNPSYDEFLLFSPYLIHGGAANLNADTTRASLEMRFWRG